MANHTLSKQEQINLNNSVDYTQAECLAELWPIALSQFKDRVALYDPHSQPEFKLTYHQLYQQIIKVASGLQKLGIKRGDRVAIFADDSPRWMILDQAILMCGAVDVVRSSQADPAELLYIIENSQSSLVILEDNKTLSKLSHQLPSLGINHLITLSNETPPTSDPLTILNFSQLLTTGDDQNYTAVKTNKNDLSTLLYTSGTTGKPKGVMLTNQNILHQISQMGAVFPAQIGEKTLCILPTWHSLGRTGEYYFLFQGCSLIYTNKRYLKTDFQKHKPEYMIGVPRLWELIYEGIQKQLREQSPKQQKLINTLFNISQNYIINNRIKNQLTLTPQPPGLLARTTATIKTLILAPIHQIATKLIYNKIRQAATGGQLKYIISGGGSLAMHLENFFEIIGLPVIVGYGLTETAPVLTARWSWQNLRGSSGRPAPQTQIKIVDPETRVTLPQGTRGLILAKGPQLMAGYYNNPQATAKVIDPEGWFDTGDLGWVTVNQDLIITGRAKDTIVLTNGENIEPQPIEDACLRSPYIDQIMLVGQDQKSIGALIVPNLDALSQWIKSQNLEPALETPPTNDHQITLDHKIIQDLYRIELTREVQSRTVYRIDDQIKTFRLIQEPFSIENGLLTQTLKIKRNVVMEQYRDIINEMFSTN